MGRLLQLLYDQKTAMSPNAPAELSPIAPLRPALSISEVLEELDGEPHLIASVEGWSPYRHTYRLPDGSVYLVALEAAEESED